MRCHIIYVHVARRSTITQHRMSKQFAQTWTKLWRRHVHYNQHTFHSIGHTPIVKVFNNFTFGHFVLFRIALVITICICTKTKQFLRCRLFSIVLPCSVSIDMKFCKYFVQRWSVPKFARSDMHLVTQLTTLVKFTIYFLFKRWFIALRSSFIFFSSVLVVWYAF